MQCSSCRTNLPDHAKFCAKCGQQQRPRTQAPPAPGQQAPEQPAPVQRPSVIEVSGMAPAGESDPFADMTGSNAGQDEQTVFATMPGAPPGPPDTEGQSFPLPGQQPQQPAPAPSPAHTPPPAHTAPEPEHAHHEEAHPDDHGPDKEETEHLLVGKNHAGFAKSFDKFRSSGGAFSATWNWPAFLFGMWWYLYRKLYVWIAIDIAVVIFIVILTALFAPFGILLLVWPVARGLLANHTYYRFILKRMESAKRNYNSERHKWEHLGGYRAYLTDLGGTVHPAVVAVPAVVLPFIALFFGGIIAAIAIPNFMKYQSASKQLLAAEGLLGLSAAQEQYYGDYGEYTDNFDDLDFVVPSGPDGEQVYCFYLSEYDAKPGNCDNYTVVDEYEAWVFEDEYVALAIGNIDSDPTLDIWAIDDTGEIYQIQDDTQN